MDKELKIIELQKKLSKINQLFRLLNIPFDCLGDDFTKFNEFIDSNDTELFELGKKVSWKNTLKENK